MFNGIIRLPPESKGKSFPKPILWNDESVKILMLNISNPQTNQWKKAVLTTQYKIQYPSVINVALKPF